MFSFQELTKSLPPLRDDEPPSLRQEIADEILDHMQCSLRREMLLNGGDELSAKQKVLEKFGDPRQIARQLWYQAMWSKIMSQRLVLGVASFCMLISALLTGAVIWVVFMHVNYTEAMQKRMLETTASIERLVSAIQKPAESAPARDPNWNHLTVTVTLDNKDGPPAEGNTIYVSRMPRIGETQVKLKGHFAVLGKNGSEDCGFVESGVYSITVTTPWGESSNTSLTILPGHDLQAHLLAPSKMPPSSIVSINLVGVPEGLDESEAAFVCTFRATGKRTACEQSWFPPMEWGSRPDFDQFGNWKNTISTQKFLMPVIMYIPGHGYWSSDSFDQSSMNVDYIAATSSWKRFQMPLASEVPDHEYQVRFNTVRLLRPVTPEDPDWRASVASDTQVQTNMNLFQQITKPVVINQDSNNWNITVPDAVILRLRQKFYSPPMHEPFKSDATEDSESEAAPADEKPKESD